MRAPTSSARRLLSWARHQPGGATAIAVAKVATTRTRDLKRRAQAVVDQRDVPPVSWTARPDWTAVTPEVPVDLGSMPHYRAESFPAAGPVPWLDRPNARRAITAASRTGRITPHEAALCRTWRRDGYVVAERLFDPDRLDHVWDAYEAAITDRSLEPPMDAGDPLPGRVLNPHQTVPEIAELASDPALLRVVELFLGASSFHFQSISGHRASQQLAHSDSIHMTTYPEHFLVAAWIAFEDIQADSGPLVYYPGSHRLRTLYSKDVGLQPDSMRQAGYSGYTDQYEPAIQRIVKERGLEEELFHARKGDVLFWHANLLHGGSPRKDPTMSRRAFVFHYFAKGCVCYHDLAGMLSPEDMVPQG